MSIGSRFCTASGPEPISTNFLTPQTTSAMIPPQNTSITSQPNIIHQPMPPNPSHHIANLLKSLFAACCLYNRQALDISPDLLYTNSKQTRILSTLVEE